MFLRYALPLITALSVSGPLLTLAADPTRAPADKMPPLREAQAAPVCGVRTDAGHWLTGPPASLPKAGISYRCHIKTVTDAVSPQNSNPEKP